jgi:hypothetical protein
MNRNSEKPSEIVRDRDEVLEVLLTGSGSDKDDLSLEECFNAWMIGYNKKSTRAEAWRLVLEKAKIFPDLRWVWDQIRKGTVESDEIWWSLRIKARGFNQLKWIWNETRAKTPEKSRAWQLLRKEASTFKQWQFLWLQTTPGGPEGAQILGFLKNKAKLLKEHQWVWDQEALK